MANRSMTASQEYITDGQIEDLVNKLRDAARKHRTTILREAAQQVLGTENLGMELLDPFRKRVEAVSNMIVRRVRVDRSRTPQQVLDDTGRRQYTDASVVETMPRHGDGVEDIDVYFFPGGRFMSDDDVEKELEAYGLTSDSYAVAAVNEADPTFADDRPNTTHWKDSSGRWCYTAFDRWGDERHVDVDRDGSGWSGGWWFGGVRK